MTISKTLLLFVVVTMITSCVGTDLVDENPSEPALNISPSAGAVIIDQAIQFSGEYRDGFDQPVADASITWISVNPSVASIESDGIATGISAGQTMIVGEFEGIQSTPAMLNVVADANQIANVTISPSSATVPTGMTAQLTAKATNVLNEEIASATFVWASSDPAVATVDNSGFISGVATGSTQIVASADGVISAPVIISVPGRTRTGNFSAAPGTSYTVRGTASVVEAASGSLTVEFGDDFLVSDGPDIQVYVSNTKNVSSTSVNIGLVKSRTGKQTYNVPSNVAFDRINFVIIHCVSFNVTFGQAEVQ